MYVNTDRFEKTEIVEIGGFPIKRLIKSHFLSATDLYTQITNQIGNVERKPTPYWYEKMKNIKQKKVREMMDSVLIEKYFLGKKRYVNDFSKLQSQKFYIKIFDFSRDIRKVNYYFHPIFFFFYYNLFLPWNDRVIVDFLYKEYFQKNVVQGNFAKKWLEYIYFRYNNPSYSVKHNPITYFHKQIRILLGPLAEHIINNGPLKKSALPCYHPHLSDLVGALQLLDISLGTNRRISDNLRKRIIDDYINQYNYKSQLIARSHSIKDDSYPIIKTLSVFSNREVYREDFWSLKRFLSSREDVA